MSAAVNIYLSICHIIYLFIFNLHFSQSNSLRHMLGNNQ